MSRHRFDGRVALVTGAGSGLGHQHAVSLARLGATVMVQDVRTQHGRTPEEATAEEVAESLRSEGFDASSDTGSIADEDYCLGLVERTVARFGRIDILINNAGHDAPGTAQDATTGAVDAAIAVNLMGAFWIQRSALGYMREQDYGRILNTSSGAGAFGIDGAIAYSMAKAALIGMTKSAALENSDRNVLVNAFCPIAFNTVLARKYAIAQSIDPEAFSTEEVTPVALYLVHEDCACSGEVLSAGAGKWSRVITGVTAGTDRLSNDIDDVFAAMDQIMDPGTFAIPGSIREQYRAS